MIGSTRKINSVRQKTVQLVAKATTTVTLNTTTDSTTAVDFRGYSSAVFYTSVLANASADPYLLLDASMDGTNYTAYATLHTDLTTTANSVVTAVHVLPEFCRLRLVHASTSTSVRYTVKVTLQP